APLADDLRRPRRPGRLHAPQPLQHAAAGAAPGQRPDLRRDRPGPGRARDEGGPRGRPGPARLRVQALLLPGAGRRGALTPAAVPGATAAGEGGAGVGDGGAGAAEPRRVRDAGVTVRRHEVRLSPLISLAAVVRDGELVAFNVGPDEVIYLVVALNPLDYRFEKSGQASFAKTIPDQAQRYRVVGLRGPQPVL